MVKISSCYFVVSLHVSMTLNPQYNDFKLPVSVEGSKNFFSETPANLWSVKKYFSCTHSDINKYKKFNRIVNDYCRDLEWIIRLETLPDEIKSYAAFLKDQKKVCIIQCFV